MSPDPPATSLVALVAADALDAELAGLALLLLDDGIPVFVAGPPSGGADALLDALVAALPADRRPDPASPATGQRIVRVAGAVSSSTPHGVLRAALSRTTGRSGLAATIDSSDLAGVLAVLRAQGLGDDEVSFLGLVLVLGDGVDGDVARPRTGRSFRVIAAHYLRPVARDAGGHVQRLGPAVVAVWDGQRGAYDHFAWGIYPELAARTGRRAGDLELEHAARATRLRVERSGDPA